MRMTTVNVTRRTGGACTGTNINKTAVRFASVLAGSDRETALSQLTSAGWTMVPNRDAIQKKYQFKDFVEAWGFMSRYSNLLSLLPHDVMTLCAIYDD